MTIRSTLRAVVYKVQRHPDSELTLAARCTSRTEGRCQWMLHATADLKAGSDAMLQHTAETGHAIFMRTVRDMAVVVLDNAQEQERRAQANRLERATAEEHARAARP
ncbi:hypothetical protein [Streptomyces sp. cg36]|uniref:hypothetical protein n=1 Tax=Streptomyces sp. cg36 TaxID=3238798 RepID=UPI0034E28312